MTNNSSSKLSRKVIQEALDSKKPYPKFPSTSDNALNILHAADCGIRVADDLHPSENFKILFNHFGLPESNIGYIALAYILAAKYVPNFETTTKRPGAPTLWRPIHYAVLYGWVEFQKKAKPNRSLSWIFNNTNPLESYFPTTNCLSPYT